MERLHCKDHEPKCGLKRLSAPVISRLRSSIILSSVEQIAEELVCNSIDAGATQIQVEVDAETCNLKVDDNGCGISRNDLSIVGERHATSKLQNLVELETGVRTLGFRGEALSSLSDIALLEITSRCRETPNTYRKILKDGATVSIGLCSRQRSHGTTVIVKDIFYNQPVRRRLLNTSHRKILQSVKERVLRFVLMHPRVSFKVTDVSRQEVSLYSKSTTSWSSTLVDIFGEDLVGSLKEIDYAQEDLRITGFLSGNFECLPSKSVQFLYINRRYVHKTRIHKLLNTWSRSNKNGPGDMFMNPSEERRAAKQDAYSEKISSPAYILNITCPFSEYDITFEASKTLVEFKNWLPVVAFVKSILQSVWGTLLSTQERGLRHDYERSPELALKKQSSSNKIRRQTSSMPSSSPNIIPPMAVRRAMVQGHLDDTCGVKKATDAEHSRADSKSRFMSKGPASSTHMINGKRSERKPSPDTLLEAELLKPTKSLTRNSNYSRDEIMLKRTWPMAVCKGNGVLKKSGEQPQGDDTFVTSIQVPRSPGDSNMFTDLELSPYNRWMTSSCNGRQIKSPSDLSLFSSSPLSLNGIHCETRLPPVHAYSRSAVGLFERLNDLNVVPRFSEGDMEGETDEAPKEVPDLNLRASFWSGSDDSFDVSVPDSSDCLPEVRSRSPHDLGPQEALSWIYCGIRGDESGTEPNWKFRKRLTLSGKAGPDEDDLPSYDYAQRLHRVFDWEDDIGEVGQCEEYGWKIHGEKDIEHFKFEANGRDHIQNFDESRTKCYIDLVSERHNPFQTSEQDSDNGSYPPRSRVKRKLDLVFLDPPNIVGTGGYISDEHETSTDDPDQGRTLVSKRQWRRLSGPPFYKPPSRCGVHENPPNSLATANRVHVVIGDSRTGKEGKRGVRTKSTVQATPKPMPQIDLSSDSSFSSTSLSSRNALRRSADDKVDQSISEGGLRGQHLHLSKAVPFQVELSDTINIAGKAAGVTIDPIEEMLKDWSNPCMKNDDGVLDLSSGILSWNSTSFLPELVVKESLKHVRVLQQVGKKFIPAVANGVLVIIDQHAADERVRLEELREDVLGAAHVKETATLDCPQELAMAFTEQQMLQSYHEQIEDWGWRFKLPFLQPPRASSTKGMVAGNCKVLLSAVPCILGVSLSGADLTEYLRQLMDTQGSSAPPPAVIRILNHKACRGAIMFGDTLLPAECKQLVEHLKQTSLCFQCAHGRPTMVPLVDLKALQKRLHLSHSSDENCKGLNQPSETTASTSESPAKEWRKLRTNKITLERSRERLKQAH